MSTTLTLTDAQVAALRTLMPLIGMDVDASAPADQTPAPAAKPAKAYRSAKGKEQAKAQVAALWAKTLADAGVTKRAQLSDAQFAAYQAGAKAIWAAVPKTRSTKA